MTDEAIPADEKPKLILIDGIERLEVARSDDFNEILSLRTLVMGLRELYGPLKNKEVMFERAGGDKVKGFVW